VKSSKNKAKEHTLTLGIVRLNHFFSKLMCY